MRSLLSFYDAIPLNAMALPGAKPDGDVNHLFKLASDHLRVAFDERAAEYGKPSPEAIISPPIPPSAGPVPCDYR